MIAETFIVKCFMGLFVRLSKVRCCTVFGIEDSNLEADITSQETHAIHIACMKRDTTPECRMYLLLSTMSCFLI